MTNLSYDALDVHVIRGRAGDDALLRPTRPLDFAGLTEEVSALAGAFRALGVVPGVSVLVDLDDDGDELLAFLAALRLRAVPVLVEHTHAQTGDGETRDGETGEGETSGHHVSGATLAVRHRPHLVVTSREWPGHVHQPAAVLYRGPEPKHPETEIDWDLAYRAGRIDPAPALTADREYAPGATAPDEPTAAVLADVHAAAAGATAYVVGDRAVLVREVPEVGTRVGRRLGALVAGRSVQVGR
ncbi:hypothetical protein [Nocardioides alkalitolerans]|uniref:hypothetical protein n=1 Tax=Nocardioides alkalitolerans TaxID=281714 RepID=UPI0004916CEB|nr:hypothetical protein [Nocardioides alkalitolerans]